MAVLVLLPGMDGTGDLFASFVQALGSTQSVQIVRYPASETLGYAELEAVAQAALPEGRPYFLLGESFSGPIAISLAASNPSQLRGLILCCTFAKNPRPGLGWVQGLAKHVPVRPPISVLEALLCGRFASPKLRSALAAVLAPVPLTALQARLAAVVSVNVLPELRSLRLPVLYLRATEDRVVPRSASELVLANCSSAQAIPLVAPHFLLQAVPEEAAAVVAKFMQEVENTL